MSTVETCRGSLLNTADSNLLFTLRQLRAAEGRTFDAQVHLTNDRELHWWTEIFAAAKFASELVKAGEEDVFRLTPANWYYDEPQVPDDAVLLHQALGLENGFAAMPLRRILRYEPCTESFHWRITPGGLTPLTYSSLYYCWELFDICNDYELQGIPDHWMRFFEPLREKYFDTSTEYQEQVVDVQWLLRLKGQKLYEVRSAVKRYDNFECVQLNEKPAPQELWDFCDDWLPRTMDKYACRVWKFAALELYGVLEGEVRSSKLCPYPVFAEYIKAPDGRIWVSGSQAGSSRAWSLQNNCALLTGTFRLRPNTCCTGWQRQWSAMRLRSTSE